MIISCKKSTTPFINDEIKDSIKENGFFISYPYNELYDVLPISNNDLDKVLLYKRLTKNDIEYYLEFNNGNVHNSFVFPFYREVDDYQPYLSYKLDSEIEKLYYKTPKKCFVIKCQYGTGDIRWNYLYEFDNKIKLKDIFYTEPRKEYIGKQDTLMDLVRFKIDKKIENISFEIIKQINNDISNVDLEEKKWLIKEK